MHYYAFDGKTNRLLPLGEYGGPQAAAQANKLYSPRKIFSRQQIDEWKQVVIRHGCWRHQHFAYNARTNRLVFVGDDPDPRFLSQFIRDAQKDTYTVFFNPKQAQLLLSTS